MFVSLTDPGRSAQIGAVGPWITLCTKRVGMHINSVNNNGMMVSGSGEDSQRNDIVMI